MYTILIADDEREEQEGVAFLLDEFGYPFEKVFAANGRIALNYLSGHHVDILFTDVRMPIMDGLALAEEARTRFPQLKIIIFSGYSEFEYARTAIRIGVTSYILKPVNVEEFKKTMDNSPMNKYKLGEMEQKFACLIWANEPIGSRVLTELCEMEFAWKRTTTYTMLKRLCQRGIFENQGGTVTARMSKAEFGAAQGEQFLCEAFDGSLPQFLAAFTHRKKLSSKEIGEIQRLIEAHKEE